MRIWVITPVYKPKKDWLDQCIQGVKAQAVGEVRHLLVVDGTQYETPPDVEVIQLDKNHNDFGDTPRHEGIRRAIAESADAIALLDDDNWYEPDHLETAVAAHHKTGAAFVATRRNMIHVSDGTNMGVCNHSGLGQFADTSTMVYFPASFPHLSIWGQIEDWQHAIDDRVVWTHLLQHAGKPALTGKPTLNYRCTHAIHYEQFGLSVPDGVKSDDRVEKAVERWEREGRGELSFKHGLASA